MTDPMTEIEDRQAGINAGSMMYRAYLGALNDGASRLDAMLIAAAWLIAAIRQPPADE